MKRMFGLVLILALAVPAWAPPASAQVLVQKARPWLGVYLVEPTPGQVEVQEVVAGSPAEKAGLKAGDRILALGGAPLAGMDAFIQAVRAEAPGSKLALMIQRGSASMPLEIVLGAEPGPATVAVPSAPAQPEKAPRAKPWLGLTIVEREDGLVLVQEVASGSPAEKAGLKAGDCILALSGKPVPGVDSLTEAVQALSAGARVSLRVLRGEEKLNLEAVLGVDPAQAPSRPPAAARQPAVPERPRIVEWPLPGAQARPGTAAVPPGDLQAALAQARKLGRPLLLEFGAAWCGPCRLLAEEMKGPELGRALQGFVVLAVDVDAQPDLADRFKVDMIPHLEVLAPGGRSVGKILGRIPVPELLGKLGDLREKALAQAGDSAGRRPEAQAIPRPRREGEARPAEAERIERETLEELRQIRKLLEEIRDTLRR